jgi:PTS system mannose-specific IIA component
MTAVLIVAHAPLASALLAVARHVYPECSEGLAAVDVLATDDLSAVELSVRVALARFDESDVLILSDVFGATPCNAAMQAADGTASEWSRVSMCLCCGEPCATPVTAWSRWSAAPLSEPRRA